MAYISLKYPFLAIHAKGGESIIPKQKDRTTTNFQKIELRKDFSIGDSAIGILFAKGGESLKKGLYFTHKYPFLAIHAKGGESISPKQKDRTTTNFKNVVFQFVLKEVF